MGAWGSCQALSDVRRTSYLDAATAIGHGYGLSLCLPPLDSVPFTLQVLEYMHSDLEAVIKDQNLVLGAADIKAYMRMLLTALATCHSKCVTGVGNHGGGHN